MSELSDGRAEEVGRLAVPTESSNEVEVSIGFHFAGIDGPFDDTRYFTELDTSSWTTFSK